MCQREPVACLGITPDALTVTAGGKTVLIVPREQMLDLMVRIGIVRRNYRPAHESALLHPCS